MRKKKQHNQCGSCKLREHGKDDGHPGGGPDETVHSGPQFIQSRTKTNYRVIIAGDININLSKEL
jgi:hypothetical protein